MISLDEPRGKRQGMPAGGSSKIVDGFWVFKAHASCICGKSFRTKGRLSLDHTDEDRSVLTRGLMSDAQDQWWECYKSHQGEFGLGALDGTV